MFRTTRLSTPLLRRQSLKALRSTMGFSLFVIILLTPLLALAAPTIRWTPNSIVETVILGPSKIVPVTLISIHTIDFGASYEDNLRDSFVKALALRSGLVALDPASAIAEVRSLLLRIIQKIGNL